VSRDTYQQNNNLGAALPDLMQAWMDGREGWASYGRPGSRRRLFGGGLDAGGCVWPVEGWTGVGSEGRGDLL
jgi:hypothetical protein